MSMNTLTWATAASVNGRYFWTPPPGPLALLASRCLFVRLVRLVRVPVRAFPCWSVLSRALRCR
eukprot:6064124-Prymnesium_polylepis.1